jgi:hypothetical protein
MSRLGKLYNASVGTTGMPARVFVSLGLVTLLLVTMLVACGDSGTPTATPTAAKTSAAPSASAASSSAAAVPPVASSAPSASPGLPLPSNSARPSTGPAASAAPSTATNAGSAAANSDGDCPETHPVKAGQLGPMKTYAISGSTSYDTMRATECFATEADAQAAGYRKSNR